MQNSAAIENLELAKKELKRADHLMFVSLKYTRTVDVLKSVLSRLLSTLEYSFIALLEQAKATGRTKTVPTQPKLRADELKKIYAEDPFVQQMVEFYFVLKKIDNAPFERRMEYRRHVTMISHIDDKKVEIDIDVVGDYFNKVEEFVTHVENVLFGKTESGQ